MPRRQTIKRLVLRRGFDNDDLNQAAFGHVFNQVGAEPLAEALGLSGELRASQPITVFGDLANDVLLLSVEP